MEVTQYTKLLEEKHKILKSKEETFKLFLKNRKRQFINPKKMDVKKGERKLKCYERGNCGNIYHKMRENEYTHARLKLCNK